MSLPNIFTKPVTDEIIQRINKLTPETNPLWGKMNVSQMLAHCSVSYEMIYENIHPKPNPFLKLILKTIVKRKVVTESPYPHSVRTAPQFLITDNRDFDKEKDKLIKYIIKTQELGENHFDNKESHSFGVLNKTEWNNMLFKHLDHHLLQFGV
ncbi:MAG TPA: DUF1569 domain-containing protein [Ignavibacteria bacterium]|nr:DUF1569 domain-containing protein [Ignavibacteria bacterium]